MNSYTPKYPMIDYWLNLPPAERTFTGIGVFSSLILTIQMGMVMLGGAVDMPEAEIADTGEGGASGGSVGEDERRWQKVGEACCHLGVEHD